MNKNEGSGSASCRDIQRPKISSIALDKLDLDTMILKQQTSFFVKICPAQCDGFGIASDAPRRKSRRKSHSPIIHQLN